MSYTGYLRWPTGATLYAKPLPIVTAAWDGDDIAGTENGSTGSYAFAGLSETTDYEVFVQAGASPASTDNAVASFPSAATTAAAVRTNLATELGRIDAAVSSRSTIDAAGVRTAVGLASANLDTQLAAIIEDTGTTIPALFPANFAALGINASGHVERVSLVDVTTTNTDMVSTDDLRSKVAY